MSSWNVVEWFLLLLAGGTVVFLVIFIHVTGTNRPCFSKPPEGWVKAQDLGSRLLRYLGVTMYLPPHHPSEGGRHRDENRRDEEDPCEHLAD